MADTEDDAIAVTRATYLQFSDVRLLHAWGMELRSMFNATAYLVGSSLVRPGYRDVDVRIMLPADQFEGLAAGCDLGRLALALSVWGQKVTGLPIDCQVQEAVAANDEFPGRRHPLGRLGVRFDGRAWPES